MYEEQNHTHPQPRKAAGGHPAQWIAVALLGAIFLTLLVSAVLLVPRLVSVADNIKTVTEQLDSSMTNIASAAEKLSEVDMESLNEAIENLGDIIAPLAALFGR